MRLAPGSQVGPYELLALIGTGAAGEVWTARDTRNSHIVAIKRLQSAHMARFRDDAGAIVELRHPNICSILELGPDYLAMEYVEGPSLRGPIAPEKAARLAIQLASAMEQAHAKGILHGDLKPANVILTRDSAKLLDFGVARTRLSAAAGGVLAKPTVPTTGAAYLSPEQAQGHVLDGRSDIFSFGALLYEMLSGRRAFTGGSFADVVNAVLREEPKPLAVPNALAGVVRGCLRKDPAERYQSMSEVRVALEQAAASNP